jgi:nickel/cobalt exporter
MHSLKPSAFSFTSVAGFVLVLISVRTGVSHPLGNFSINHYTRIRVKPAEIELVYLLDMAEIPSYSEFLEIDTDEDGNVTSEEQERYLARKVPELLRDLEIRVAGTTIEATVSRSFMKFPMGEGGQTLVNVIIRSRIGFHGSEGRTVAFEFLDRTCADQLGQAAVQIEPDEAVEFTLDTSLYGEKQSEVVHRVGNRILVQDSKVAFEVVSGAEPTSAVPTEKPPLLPTATPIRVAEVSIQRVETVPPVSPPRMKPLDYACDVFSATLADVPLLTGRRAEMETDDTFVDRTGRWLRQKEWTTRMLVVAFLLAFVAGGFHALKPGHGKAIAAAYLVGSRGTPIHALILGGIVTLTHTGSILILGTILLLALKSTQQATVQMWIEVASGVIIVGLGLILFYRRLSALVGSRTSPARVHNHNHPHDEDHPHQRGHDHEIPDRVTWGSLIALGFSGGIVPCPGALLLLTAAMAARRIGLGLLLILVYSFGLGVALITIGMLTVMSKTFLEKRFDFRAGRMRWLPVLSPVAITFFGLVIIARALVSAGIIDIGIQL